MTKYRPTGTAMRHFPTDHYQIMRDTWPFPMYFTYLGSGWPYSRMVGMAFTRRGAMRQIARNERRQSLPLPPPPKVIDTIP